MAFLNEWLQEQPVVDKESKESPIKTYTFARDVFKLPIYYLDETKKQVLDSNVINDLELVNGIDENNPSIYSIVFSPKTNFGKQVVPLFQKFHTTDTDFLQDTQTVVRNMREGFSLSTTNENNDSGIDDSTIERNWHAVKHDPKFIETYGYLEWDMLKEYNKNSVVLQSLSLSSMLSPLMSLILPILFLLIPFVLLKMQGIPLSIGTYFQILKEVARNHFIGQALHIFESFSLQRLLYLGIMLGLYGFQMYQNITQCRRFYHNTEKMNEELCKWKSYRAQSARQIETFLQKNDNLITYGPFCNELRMHSNVLQELYYVLQPIQPFSCSITKTTEVGYMLKCYYELHTNEEYEKTILFCMGFQGYLHCLYNLQTRIANNDMSIATYLETTSIDSSNNESSEIHTEIKKQYYPLHMEELGETACVKNDVVLDTYGVITGPNASGKTTYLKATAINVILSQQIGCGFYESCQMIPYTHIHSYLNIPDTSGRDSLFQAESRRCKQILNKIEEDNSDRHFCIFDELYSGTNPNEATKAAYAFLQYLRKHSRVDLFLTTHYVSICDKWEEDMLDDSSKYHQRNIQNYQMIVETVDNKRVPTYTISHGISRIEGAIDILTDMEYPPEMIAMFQTDDVNV